VGEWAGSLSERAAGGLISLEQLTAKFCTNARSPMMIAKNRATKSAVFFRPRCKMWKCPYCAKINSDLWIMRVTHGCHELIEMGHDLSFVTVTSHEKLTAKQSVQTLPDSWHKLSMRLRRHVKGVQYVVIPERHKNGRLHIHGVFLSGADRRWWKDNARSCGMGYQAEAKPVYSASGAGFYCGKYLAKQLSDERWKKGFRRIRTSQAFPKLPPLERAEGWTFSIISQGESVSEHTKQLADAAYRVALADNATAWEVLDRFSIPT